MREWTSIPLPHGRSSFPVRRGGATAGLIATLVVFSGLVTTAIVFSPKFAGASAHHSDVKTLQQPLHERQIVTNSIASLLGSSHQVLVVHDRASSPYFELVLWVDDRYNRGTIDPAEIAVVAHSRVLQTVTWFSLMPGDVAHETWESLGSEVLRMELLQEPGFCDRWRAHHAVAPRVISTGVSDLTVEIAQQVDAHTAVLKLDVIWPDDSTDSPTETTAQVHVALRADSD